MSARDTSLAAYHALEDSGALQEQERALMILIHRHYTGSTFTRKELADKTGWPINRVTGRVFSLVDKGFLEESKTKIRDGGRLLRIAQKAAPQECPPKGNERAADNQAHTPTDAAPHEQLITVHYTATVNGKKVTRTYQYTAVGFAEG